MPAKGMLDPFPNAPPEIVPGAETDRSLAIDPLADLLLSVVAIVVLAIIAILPSIPRHPANDNSRSHRGIPADAKFQLDGVDIEPFVATKDGLSIGGPTARLIPVNRIFDDEDLIAKLEQMRSADKTAVLFIDPNGFETAFQFEVIANTHGPKRMRQVRFDSECHHAKSKRVACDSTRESQGRHL